MEVFTAAPEGLDVKVTVSVLPRVTVAQPDTETAATSKPPITKAFFILSTFKLVNVH